MSPTGSGCPGRPSGWSSATTAASAPKPAQRILQAADELGYQPDVAAQTLRQRASKYLGVVFTPTQTAEVDILDALYPAAKADDYGVVLSALTSTRDASTAIDEVLGYRCAALLIIGLTLDPSVLRRLSGRIPVVMIGGNKAEDTGCDYVRSAGDVGIGLAVAHLADLGHRDIAYVHGKTCPVPRCATAATPSHAATQTPPPDHLHQ